MRILFLAWRDLAHPNAGGSEVVIDRLIRELNERGHDASLMCGGPVEDRPYRVIKNGGTYSQYLLAPFRYWRHMRDVDVVVDVVNGVPFLTPLWRRRPVVGFFQHVHGDQWRAYFPGPVARFFGSLEQRGVPQIYREVPMITVSTSTATKLEMLGVRPSQIHIIDNGVDVESLDNPPEKSSTPLFLAVGRLAANKRIDLLLDMWPEVHRRVGGRLVIVGDGPEHTRLVERVNADPALGSVEIAGRVTAERKTSLLHESWLLVHAAEREGWGIVIIEAARCGTPTLAFNVTGVRDAVVNGKTGVLAKDEAAFTSEWIKLALDDERRSTLAETALQRSQSFTWQRTVELFMDGVMAASETRRRTLVSKARSSLARRRMRSRRREVPSTAGDAAVAKYLATDTERILQRYVDLRHVTAIDLDQSGSSLLPLFEHTNITRLTIEEVASAEHHPAHRPNESAESLTQGATTIRPKILIGTNVNRRFPDWEMVLDCAIREMAPRGFGFLAFDESIGAGRLAQERSASRSRRESDASMISEWLQSRSEVNVLFVRPRDVPRWLYSALRHISIDGLVGGQFIVGFRRRADGA